MARSTRHLVLWSVVTAVLVAASLLYFYPRPEQYRSFQSPTGNYQIVLYRYPQRLSTMPGQGSDAPGLARLYDHTGKMLYQVDVPMVSIVDRVEWGPDSVTVPGLFDWRLSQP